MAMHVKAVASTSIDFGALEEAGYIPHNKRLQDSEPGIPEDLPESEDPFATTPEWEAWFEESYPQDIDELHEAAGRGCYQSWNRPNPATATNKGYLKNIIDVAHESVLGHAHVTFYVAGVSRALLLELERHAEHMNINLSVVSQRYVDHSEAEFVVPPLLEPYLDEEIIPGFATVRDCLTVLHSEAQSTYSELVAFLKRKGYSRKEIRGAARAVLPENTETKFFVTGSIRAWRDIIRKRAVDGADVEIRLFAIEVLKELVRLAPNSVQDFAEMHELGESK